MIKIEIDKLKEGINMGLGSQGIWTPELSEIMLIEIQNKALNIDDVSVSDSEIEKESQQRYGEVTGGSYHADRPYNRKCFRKGAEWMRNKLTNHSRYRPSACGSSRLRKIKSFFEGNLLIF